MENTVAKRHLGKTGMDVTSLCYGCAAAFARPLITDTQAVDLFRRAYDLGIRFFDTGHNYGRAEERIGMALRQNSDIDRKNIIISTKCGSRIVNDKKVHDVSVDWIKESVETSLKRMGISYIDILYLHGPSYADIHNDGLLHLLQDMKSSGLIRATGANTFNSKVIASIAREKQFDVVMLDYNIIKQRREAEIKALYDSGIGVVAGQALAESVFSNSLYKIRSKKDIWYLARTIGRKASRKMFLEGRKFRFLNHLKELDGAQVALKYVLDNPCISAASFGTCSFDHLSKNVSSLDVTIPDDVLQKIRSAP